MMKSLSRKHASSIFRSLAIVDTNGDPEPIDYPIAANDDAVKSIKVIMDTFVETIKDAAELYGKEGPPRTRRKPKPLPLKERRMNPNAAARRVKAGMAKAASARSRSVLPANRLTVLPKRKAKKGRSYD